MLLAVLGVAVALDEAAATRPAIELHRRARELAREMADIGFRLDLDALSIEVVTPADFARQIQSPPIDRSVRVLGALLHIQRNNQPSPSDRELAQLLASDFAQRSTGLYVAESDTIFLRDDADAPPGRPLDDDLRLCHELAHAWQAHGGMAFRSEGTTEEHALDECLREGQADAIAYQTLLRRVGRTLDGIAPDAMFDVTTNSSEIDGRLSYSVGARAILLRLAREGDRAVRAPNGGFASTEQCIHPEKVSDQPSVVDLPAPSGTDWDEDTIGELGLYRMLRSPLTDRQSLSPSFAWQLAAGWDGDRLRLERLPGGRSTVVWRLVFDRRVDAGQFASEMSRHWAFDVKQRDACVDLAWGSTPELHQQAAARLAAHPCDYTPDAEDARTAGLAGEDAPWYHRFRVTDVATDANRPAARQVIVPSLGLEIPLADGWRFDEYTALGELVDEGDPPASSFAVTASRFLGEESTNALRGWLEQGAIRMLECEDIEISGHSALLAHRQQAAPIERHHLGLLLLRDGRLILLRMSSAEPPGAADRAMLRGVTLAGHER